VLQFNWRVAWATLILISLGGYPGGIFPNYAEEVEMHTHINTVYCDRENNRAYVFLADGTKIHIGRVDYVDKLPQSDLRELITISVRQTLHPDEGKVH